eukprot:COSAG01_NODE_2042_length_8567_cov_430.763935_5_plen_40_part_00
MTVEVIDRACDALDPNSHGEITYEGAYPRPASPVRLTGM